MDNNSTDTTAQIAKKFGATVITEKKQGYVFAFNTGVTSAPSEIIAVTDSDTIVPPDWLEKINKYMSENNIVGLCGKLNMTTSNKLIESLTNTFYDWFTAFHFFIGKPHMSGPCIAFLKSKNSETGGIDTNNKTGADVELGLRLKSVGNVLYARDIEVTTSSRRWNNNRLKHLRTYISAYFRVVWLHKSSQTELNPIR